MLLLFLTLKFLKERVTPSGTQWVPMDLLLNFTVSKIHHHPAVDSRMLCKLTLLMSSMTFYHLSSPVHPPNPLKTSGRWRAPLSVAASVEPAAHLPSTIHCFSLESPSQSPLPDPPHSPMSKSSEGCLIHWDIFSRWVISSSPVALNANLMLMTLKFLLPT